MWMCWLPYCCHAQAHLFTQQESVSLWINPAYATTNTEVAAHLLYRSQYFGDSHILQLPSFQFIYPILDRDQTRQWGGVGVSFLQENFGHAALYRNTGIGLSFAYRMPLSENTQLSFGMQGAYFLRRLGTESFTTESQYLSGQLGDPALFDEEIARWRVDFPAVNAGLLIRQHPQQMPCPNIEVAIGGAFLNRPNISFFDIPVVMQPRTFVFMQKSVWQSQQQALLASLRWSYQAADHQWRIGMEYVQHFSTSTRLGGGLWWQHTHALLQAHVQQDNYRFTFSSDLNFSTKGYPYAIEIGIAWIKPFELKKKKNRRISSPPLPAQQPKPDVVVFTREPVEVQPPKPSQLPSSAEQQLLRQVFYFNQGSSQLDSLMRYRLEEIANLLKKYPGIILKIEGHTCSYREEMGNEKLSFERAYSIKSELEAHGIAAQRLIVDGFADRKPVANNETELGRQRNRRAELIPLL